MKPRVALITHDMSLGGLSTMTTFLHHALTQSGRYEADLILLATSVSDSASLRLRDPRSWLSGAELREIQWHHLSYTHVGAWGIELEFQRYQPRRKLSALLREYDLLQFVVGSAPWACVAANINRPIIVWTATTTRADRLSRMRVGSLPRRAWSKLMLQLVEGYELRALQRADAVFALSDYTLSSVRAMMKTDEAQLAPCGVDTDLFHPASAPLPARDYILCVARLSDRRKNVEMLLRAYAMLLRKNKNLPDLYLAGEPPSPASQKLLDQLGIADRVKLVGIKRGEELAELYRKALFFVLSSDEEGLAIVILEAMASGLSVVSTDCGGPATAVEDGKSGLLTPVGDAQALAAAMERLLKDEELREKMGRAGRRIAVERFSLAAVGKIFLDKYDELLAGHPQPMLDRVNLQPRGLSSEQ
jgi:glycosyltransferase involved in cell wall biosynthesis